VAAVQPGRAEGGEAVEQRARRADEPAEVRGEVRVAALFAGQGQGPSALRRRASSPPHHCSSSVASKEGGARLGGEVVVEQLPELSEQLGLRVVVVIPHLPHLWSESV
jgi:hypothetical protein